jgi:hypothetical protein
VWILSLSTLPAAVFPDPLFADQTTQGGAVSSVQLQKGSVEAGGILGTTLPITLFRAKSNRRLTLGAFQFGRVITNERGHRPLAGSFELLLEVAPLMLLRQPAPAFGVTASPVHMRWNFAPVRSGSIRVFAEASGGVLYTNQEVPPGTTAFNFIDQAGFGMRFERNPRRAWLLGYRFQHISNGGRVKPNPGANFNFVYAGVSFHRS